MSFRKYFFLLAAWVNFNLYVSPLAGLLPESLLKDVIFFFFKFQVVEDNKPIKDVYTLFGKSLFYTLFLLKEQVQKIVLKMTANWIPCRPKFHIGFQVDLNFTYVHSIPIQGRQWLVCITFLTLCVL